MQAVNRNQTLEVRAIEQNVEEIQERKSFYFLLPMKCLLASFDCFRWN